MARSLPSSAWSSPRHIGYHVITVSSYWTLSNELLSGRTQVVEGEITNFLPGKARCHDRENFDVSEIHFAYADNEITGGFNHTSMCGGGPFHAGQHVRLNYVSRFDTNVIVHGDIWE